jgi:hypothetical protein
MPPTNAAPDAELARLLDALADAAHARGEQGYPWQDCPGEELQEKEQVARAALLAYLARAYVRRDRLYDDGPFDPGDGSAYGAALEREGEDVAP